MKREVGLWIDHHKALMVFVVNEKEETREIRSNIEKAPRSPGASRPKGSAASATSTSEDGGDRKAGNHLGEYYDGVVSLLRNADTIWIFGPGEAKVELKKRLEHANLGGRIAGVDTVDKMTDRQIVDKVRQHYQQLNY